MDAIREKKKNHQDLLRNMAWIVFTKAQANVLLKQDRTNLQLVFKIPQVTKQYLTQEDCSTRLLEAGCLETD